MWNISWIHWHSSVCLNLSKINSNDHNDKHSVQSTKSSPVHHQTKGSRQWIFFSHWNLKWLVTSLSQSYHSRKPIFLSIYLTISQSMTKNLDSQLVEKAFTAYIFYISKYFFYIFKNILNSITLKKWSTIIWILRTWGILRASQTINEFKKFIF